MIKILKNVINYFDLQIDTSPEVYTNAERGIRNHKFITTIKPISMRSLKDIIWWLCMYLATIFGVFCKYLFDIFSKSTYTLKKEFFIQKLILASIISIVIFPTIYKNAIMDPKNPGFIQLCISFQNGFFWQTIIGEVSVA